MHSNLHFIYRGGNIDIGCVKSGGSTSTDGPGLPSKDPTWLDMLVANATILSYVANRYPIKGTYTLDIFAQNITIKGY